MTAKDEFAGYCAELFASIGPVRVRRMFGGHGIYVDDLFVAIITGDCLYLKADRQSAAAFEQAGGTRFAYQARGRSVSLQFWTPPAHAMDSPQLMQPWAHLAAQAALRSRAQKPARIKRSSASRRSGMAR